MKKRYNKGEHAEPSYADMLQETVALPPPDGYPPPVILPPPAVAAPAKRRSASRRAKSMADYGMEPQVSLSKPERVKD